MTLLITVIFACAATVIWYRSERSDMLLHILCLIYWGASLMWLADAIFEYAKLGAKYFEPSVLELVNDSFLGLSAAALGFVIWLAILLIKDPCGKISSIISHNDSAAK